MFSIHIYILSQNVICYTFFLIKKKNLFQCWTAAVVIVNKSTSKCKSWFDKDTDCFVVGIINQDNKWGGWNKGGELESEF